VASFVGYLPADDPQLVVLAKLTDPKSSIYGGGVAAPVSRTVVQAILAAAESGLVSGRVVGPTEGPYDWETGTGLAADRAVAQEEPPFRFVAVGPPTPQAESVSDAVPGADVILPDLTGVGIRAATTRLHGLGLRVEIRTSGRVARTEPAPGTRVLPGARVLLR
jgi:cell division protein FtsI (penicillin-binding protein 3)